MELDKHCSANFKTYGKEKFSYYSLSLNNVPGSTKYRPNYRASLPSKDFKYSIAPDDYNVDVREPSPNQKQCIDD
jgi:hypothetical protein